MAAPPFPPLLPYFLPPHPIPQVLRAKILLPFTVRSQAFLIPTTCITTQLHLQSLPGGLPQCQVTWAVLSLGAAALFSALAKNGCHVNQSKQGLLAVSPGERVPPQAGG